MAPFRGLPHTTGSAGGSDSWAKGDGSSPEPLWKTDDRRIPSEGVRFRASPSWFRLHPLVPGLLSFRARVILLADGPTRPIQRLPVPGRVRPFPHPEPPLLFSEDYRCPVRMGIPGRINIRSAPSSRRMTRSGYGLQADETSPTRANAVLPTAIAHVVIHVGIPSQAQGKTCVAHWPSGCQPLTAGWRGS